MEMLERQYEFGDVKPRALFAEPRLALQVPKQLAATFEVGDKIEISVSFEAKFEPNEEG
jgi:hypothetical protein